MSFPSNPKHLDRFTSRPTPETSSVMERWLKNRVDRDTRLACPDDLAKRAVKNGKALGMKVKIIYTNEWQVHMTTKRGPVIAAPMIAEQTCMDGCQGTGVRPHILDGGGSPCDRCNGNSVTLEEAWRNALAELGLMSE